MANVPILPEIQIPGQALQCPAVAQESDISAEVVIHTAEVAHRAKRLKVENPADAVATAIVNVQVFGRFGNAAIQASLDALNQKVDAVNQKADAANQKLDAVLEMASAISYNSIVRARHALFTDRSRVLLPLKKEKAGGNAQLGALPPTGTFPETPGHLWALTAARVDALEQFYNETFAARSLDVRREKVALFIGVPH